MTNMHSQSNELFGIRRSTILIISVALTIGSFSAWKALGGGSHTTAVAGLQTERSVVAGLQTEPHSSTVRSPAAHTTASLGSAILTKADADAANRPGSAAADRPTEPHPAVKTDLIPIEQIQVGDRVLAESPTGEEDTAFGSEIIPSDWRKLTLRAPKRDGTVAEVVLLRPLTWLNEQHGEVGGTVFISVPECGIDGNANVLAIEPCPAIPSGAGRVVTGTFLHQARSTITLTIAGQTEPIECTGNHPFWSEDRRTFVRADSLQPNESLRTATGLTTVESWTPDLNPTPVYNIEVHGAHVYHVGTSGVVVHNPGGLNILDCDEWVSIYKAPGRGFDIDGTIKNGLNTAEFGAHGAFFSTVPDVAHKYAQNYGRGAFEFRVPRDVYDNLVREGKIVIDTNEISSIAILPSAFNSINSMGVWKYFDPSSIDFLHVFGLP
jgi:hypothetical protein